MVIVVILVILMKFIKGLTRVETHKERKPLASNELTKPLSNKLEMKRKNKLNENESPRCGFELTKVVNDLGYDC
jgi:hypothetical protein